MLRGTERFPFRFLCCGHGKDAFSSSYEAIWHTMMAIFFEPQSNFHGGTYAAVIEMMRFLRATKK